MHYTAIKLCTISQSTFLHHVSSYVSFFSLSSVLLNHISSNQLACFIYLITHYYGRLHSRCGYHIFAPRFLLSFFFSSPNLSRCRLDICHTCTHGLSANLWCRSETCCMWLPENTGCKNSPSGHYLTTLSGYILATIGKKLVKQQYLLHMSPQYGELRPTSGWDRSGSLGHPS